MHHPLLLPALLLISVSVFVAMPADSVDVDMDTSIPKWVLEENLTIGGSYRGTPGQLIDDGFDDFAAGNTENVTIRHEGVVLEPDLGFSILNNGEAILENEGPSKWDVTLRFGSTIKVGSTYYLYYTGGPSWQSCAVGLATSTDGVSFTKHAQNPIFSPTGSERSLAKPYVYHDGSAWYMYYSMWDGIGIDIHLATSADGVSWTRSSDNPIIAHGGRSDWDYALQVGYVLKDGGKYRMYYYGYAQGGPMYLATATSSDLRTWTGYAGNPLRRSDTAGWEEPRTSYGTAQVFNGTYRLWATSGDVYGSWYLGWMRSDDAIQFTRSEDAVLYPKQGTIYANGVRDPYIIDEGDHYLMLCLCYNSSGVATYGAFRIQKVNHWGKFTSRILDAGGEVEITGVSWKKEINDEGDIKLSLRWSNDNRMWSDWTEVNGTLEPIGTRARYFQYKADFSTPMEWYDQSLIKFSISYISPVASIVLRVDTGSYEQVIFRHGRWEATMTLEDGDHKVTVIAEDTKGERKAITFIVRVDLLPPTGGIVIEQGRRYTNSTSLHYDIWANDTHGVPLYKVSTSSYFYEVDWMDFPLMCNGTIEYSGLDGPVVVFVVFKDIVGRVSKVYHDDIIVDMTPPSGYMTINHGAKYTSDIDVRLSIKWYDMTGVVGMKVFNDPSFEELEWQDPVTGMDWTLEDEEGLRTVYVELIDVVGWVTLMHDDIVLDMTPPVASFVINDDAVYTISRKVTLNVLLWHKEPVIFLLANSGDPWPLEWQQLSEDMTIPWVLKDGVDGPREVLMKAKDRAGNEVEVSDTITLDTTPPTGEMHIDAGAIFTNDEWVEITIEANDSTSGLDTMRVSNDPMFQDAPWQKVVTSFDWRLQGGQGPQVVYVQLRDGAGLTTVLRGSIIMDTVPPSGLVIVDGGAAHSADLEVSVELDIFDDTSGIQEMMVSNDEEFEGASWESFRISFDWTLAEGDGEKIIFVRVRDQSGLVGNLWGTIVLDTTPPVLTVVVNGGERYTTSSKVMVELIVEPDTSGVQEMAISLSEDFAGADWAPFREIVDYDLAPDDGEQILYVKVRDGAGHVTILTGTVTLDTSPPTGTFKINNGDAFTNKTLVTLTISAGDATGIAGMRVSEDQTFAGASWMDLVEEMEVDLSSGDGEKMVYLQFMDGAGLISVTGSTILLDTIPPTVTIIKPEEETTSEERVTFVFTVEDSVDRDPTCEYRVDGGDWREISGTEFRLDFKEGRHTVEVRATDASRNSAIASLDIVVDIPIIFKTGRNLYIILVIVTILGLSCSYILRGKRNRDYQSEFRRPNH